MNSSSPRSGVSKVEYILVVGGVAVAATAALAVFSRQIERAFHTATASLDSGAAPTAATPATDPALASPANGPAPSTAASPPDREGTVPSVTWRSNGDEEAHGISDPVKDVRPANADDQAAVSTIRARLPHAILRDSSVPLGGVSESTNFNPGSAHASFSPTGGPHTRHYVVAEYVLRNEDSPWVGVWGTSQANFQDRIVTHELAHLLHSQHQNLVNKFLNLRWNKTLDPRSIEVLRGTNATKRNTIAYSELFQYLNQKALEAHAEALRENTGGVEPADPVGARIAALRAADARVRELVEAASLGPLPSRFPGDLHGLYNGREYFATAVELFFFDPQGFQASFSREEQAMIAEFFDGDGKDELHPVRG